MKSIALFLIFGTALLASDAPIRNLLPIPPGYAPAKNPEAYSQNGANPVLVLVDKDGASIRIFYDENYQIPGGDLEAFRKEMMESLFPPGSPVTLLRSAVVTGSPDSKWIRGELKGTIESRAYFGIMALKAFQGGILRVEGRTFEKTIDGLRKSCDEMMLKAGKPNQTSGPTAPAGRGSR